MSRILDAIHQAIMDRDADRVRKLILKEKEESDEFPYLLDAWAMLALRLCDGPMAEGLTFPLSLRWSERRDYATGMARTLHLCPRMIYGPNGLGLCLPPIKPGRMVSRVPDGCFAAAQALLANPEFKNRADHGPVGFRKYHLMMCVTGRLIGTPRADNPVYAYNRNSPFVTSFHMLHEEIGVEWDFGRFVLPQATADMLDLLMKVGLLAAALKTPASLRTPDEAEVIAALIENVAPRADHYFDSIRGQFRTFAELCDFFLRPDLFRPIALTHYVVLDSLDKHFGLGAYYNRGVIATLEAGPPSVFVDHVHSAGPKLMPHEDASEQSPMPGFFRRLFSRKTGL